jgi:hypothetical protein
MGSKKHTIEALLKHEFFAELKKQSKKQKAAEVAFSAKFESLQKSDSTQGWSPKNLRTKN